MEITEGARKPKEGRTLIYTKQGLLCEWFRRRRSLLVG